MTKIKIAARCVCCGAAYAPIEDGETSHLCGKCNLIGVVSEPGLRYLKNNKPHYYKWNGRWRSNIHMTSFYKMDEINLARIAHTNRLNGKVTE